MGIHNGLTGEMIMYQALSFHIGDLAKYDNYYFDFWTPGLNKPDFVNLFLAWYNFEVYTHESALYFMYTSYGVTWEITEFYNSKNDKIITQEERENLEYGLNSVYEYVRPTQKGKELEIVNSTKFTAEFIKI